MVRSSPRRGQRSKGFKVKHCLQLTLLLGVGIWLIYQMKHSHEKKPVFEETAKMEDKVVKLGRKDLNPRVEQTKNEMKDEGSNNEETFDGGDSGTHVKFGKENADESVEREEERGEETAIDDKETQGTGNDDESEGGNETSSEEAREKNYKADNASSEVVHEMEEKNAVKMQVEEERKSNITENVSFHEDESGPKDSVIKSVSSNTTEENGETGGDDGEKQEIKNELDSKTEAEENTSSSLSDETRTESVVLEKGFSDSSGELPESNQSSSNATEKASDGDERDKSTGYQETKNEEDEQEMVQSSQLSSEEESKNKDSEKKKKKESSSQEESKHIEQVESTDSSNTQEKSDQHKTDESKSESSNEQSKSDSDIKETEDETSKTESDKEKNNKSGETENDEEHTKSTLENSVPPQDVKDAPTDLKTLPESSNGLSNDKVAAE